MEGEIVADLIQTFYENDFPFEKLDEPVIDYALRCTKGIFKDYFIYLNVTQQGEIIGSLNENDVTLTIEDAELAPRQAMIKVEMDEELGRLCYVLRDLKSGQPTWVKIRSDMPVVVKNHMMIKIGKLVYQLNYSDQIVNEAYDWIQYYEMNYLEKVFEENKIQSLNEIRDLTRTQIEKLFKHYNFDQEKLEQFLQNQAEINTQFPQGYSKFKLQVTNVQTNEKVLLVGWSGATISSKTYVYQKPPEKLVHKQEFDDYEENPFFELIIRFLYGRYVLQTWKTDNYNVFFKVDDFHILIPDDTIKLGNLELVTQRFNTGFALDYGSYSYMEDAISIINDLGVSNKVAVSCYGVFDGHNGDECVKYMSQNLFDNLREQILICNPPFDQQPKFFEFMREIIKKTFVFTDEEFYQDFIEDKAIWTGCVSAVAIIVGDYLIAANVGDCRVLLSSGGQAISMTMDHKPQYQKEKERIEKKGGMVIAGRLGKLAVSRAFGDFSYKKQREKSGKNLLSVKPDIRAHKIDYKVDEFVALFSDGVLEAFNTNQNLVNFIRERYLENKLMEQDPQSVCKDVLAYTYETVMKQRHRSDNLSIILVNLTRGITAKASLQSVKIS